LWGLRVAAGELVGATVEFAAAVPAGLETGNANVGSGEKDGVTDAVDKGDGVTLGDDEGLGVGEGGMISSQ
jgi:hypothetical protein